MSDRNLLDLMLDDTRRHEKADEVAEVVKEALDKIDAPGDRPKIEREPKDVEIETKRRRYTADPHAWGSEAHSGELSGLKVGSTFIITSGGEQLEGDWVVVRMNLTFKSADERHLYAGRPGASGPPYLKITEADLAADIDDGVIRIK
jgi:hypothetical protein